MAYSYAFDDIEWREYEDSLYITEAEPLISYVLSCHGNQNQYLSDHYKDFRSFMKKRLANGFKITKADLQFCACNIINAIAKNTALKIYVITVIIEGIISVKPFEYFIAIAQTISKIPANNNINHFIYLSPFNKNSA